MTRSADRVPASTRVADFIVARRSIRAFSDAPISREVLDALVEGACLAPAPHHSRPWRFVIVTSPEAKTALARAMGARWEEDLAGDGVDSVRVAELVEASRAKLTDAPALVVGCLTWSGLDRYPDERRRQAEWGMGLLSLGAAMENLMLGATAVGLATCWVAAPIFCPPEARDGLGLDEKWLPHALVLIGEPDPGYHPPPRPAVPLDELRTTR